MSTMTEQVGQLEGSKESFSVEFIECVTTLFVLKVCRYWEQICTTVLYF